MSHWAPTGNEVDLEFADFARYFADQDDVGVIAAYIEGFKDGRTLMLAADHAAAAQVPIVAVKVGRTDEGRSMAKAHTGHLTGADAVVSAVFRQFGVTRVDGLDELLDTSSMLARTKPPKGDGVCVYAISGGTGAHMADLAAAEGLRLPELTKKTQEALRQWIPDYLRVSNPVDNGGPPVGRRAGPQDPRRHRGRPQRRPGHLPDHRRPAVDGQPAHHRPGRRGQDDRQAHLRDLGLPHLRRHRLRQDAAAGRHPDLPRLRQLRAGREGVLRLPRLRRPLPLAVRQARHQAVAGGGQGAVDPRRRHGALSEHESKQLLAAYGIPVTEERLCTSRKEAVKAAEAIGYPVVLKVSSAKILHKSDLGLVRVGVTSEKKVRAIYDELMEAKGADGVLVSEQVEPGVETVVGIAQDDLFGPTVMFGIGGVFLEVLKDVTFRVPPFDKREARRMVEEVQGPPPAPGRSRRPKADIAAIVDVIMKVQRLAVDLHDEVAELDINPWSPCPSGRWPSTPWWCAHDRRSS